MRKVRFIICIILTQLLFALGACAQTQQELRDSLSMINRLIDQHPKAVKLYLRKAALNIELGDWQYALDTYSKVLDMMPGNLTALYYRGFVYQHLKRYGMARNDYELLLKLEPNHQHALMGLIVTNLADGRITAAFDDANRLVELFPEDAQSYAVRADVEKQQNMLSPALDDIKKAIKIENVAVQKRYPVTVEDEITAYQLTAFDIYMAMKDTRSARACIDYLVKNGVPRAYLNKYYKQLEKRR